MRIPVLAAVVVLAIAGPAVADFKFTFTWGDIPLCTTGNPNTVGSPRFVVTDIPDGALTLRFRLKDLDAPNYNHGGGTVTITSGAGTGGSVVIPFGTFQYKSPCPPGGRHTYEWTVIAKGDREVLGKATARRRYPE
jgi:phosphatidylethanolamine-binding protein (PEBP) family uncharacterized protein